MIQARGVLPLSDSVRDWMNKHVGRTSGLGLTAMLAACRRDRTLRDAGDIQSKHVHTHDHVESWAELACRTTEYILRDMGFADSDIREACATCGNNVLACVDFCVAGASAPVVDSAVDTAASSQ